MSLSSGRPLLVTGCGIECAFLERFEVGSIPVVGGGVIIIGWSGNTIAGSFGVLKSICGMSYTRVVKVEEVIDSLTIE